jgi:hypothetical protein
MNVVGNTIKPNGNVSSFVENKKDYEKVHFAVYRKRWLWGEKFFCICEEIMEFESVFLMKSNNIVIGVLPSESFSSAIAVEYKDEYAKST